MIKTIQIFPQELHKNVENNFYSTHWSHWNVFEAKQQLSLSLSLSTKHCIASLFIFECFQA